MPQDVLELSDHARLLMGRAAEIAPEIRSTYRLMQPVVSKRQRIGRDEI